MTFLSGCPTLHHPVPECLPLCAFKEIAYGSVGVPVIQSSHVACRNEGHHAQVTLVQYFLMKYDGPFVQLCLIRHEYI